MRKQTSFGIWNVRCLEVKTWKCCLNHPEMASWHNKWHVNAADSFLDPVETLPHLHQSRHPHSLPECSPGPSSTTSRNAGSTVNLKNAVLTSGLSEPLLNLPNLPNPKIEVCQDAKFAAFCFVAVHQSRKFIWILENSMSVHLFNVHRGLKFEIEIHMSTLKPSSQAPCRVLSPCEETPVGLLDGSTVTSLWFHQLNLGKI